MFLKISNLFTSIVRFRADSRSVPRDTIKVWMANLISSAWSELNGRISANIDEYELKVITPSRAPSGKRSIILVGERSHLLHIHCVWNLRHHLFKAVFKCGKRLPIDSDVSIKIKKEVVGRSALWMTVKAGAVSTSPSSGEFLNHTLNACQLAPKLWQPDS